MKSLMPAWRPYKIILSIAAGAMLFVLSSSSFAAEQYTINSSEDYIDPSVAQDMVDSYVPFVNASQGFCSGGSCSAHGEAAVEAWANSTFFSADHTDDDGGARDKFVPGMAIPTLTNFTMLSMDIFGIGRGITQPWFIEYLSLSTDECGGANDPLTSPGRTIGDGLVGDGSGGTDNCTTAFNSLSVTNYYEEQVTLWETDPGYFGNAWVSGNITNADSLGSCNLAPKWDFTNHTYLDSGNPFTEAEWLCLFEFGGTYDSVQYAELEAASALPPGGGTPVQNVRDEWVDQVVIGYISTGDNFAQNFRSSLTFGNSWFSGANGENVDRANIETWTKTESEGGVSLNCATNVAECYTILDFRLEQGDTDMENKNDNAQFSSNPADLNTGANSGTNRIINAFQMNMATVSAPNTTAGGNATNSSLAPDCVENQDPGDDTYGTLPQADSTSMGCVKKGQWAENIEQNMAGYFYSCINCSLDGAEHEYSAPEKALFQAWLVDMPEITSIIHAGTASLTSRLN